MRWLLVMLALGACAPRAPEPERLPFTVDEGFHHAMAGMDDLPLRERSHTRAAFSRVVRAVGQAVARVPYQAWAVGYWQTPAEFVRDGGACGGYASTSYYYLYRNGVADAEMRLLVVQVRATGEYHALLRVDHGGRVYVLDNMAKGVQGAAWLERYKVVYAINRIGGQAYGGN